MEDIEQLMNRLVKEGADTIIVNPANIERLRKQGVNFDKVPKKCLEECIDLLFSERKKLSLEMAKKLPDPPLISAPAIESLYNEIRECIILGLHGAAITLSGILVEFTLKYVTYAREMGGFTEYDAKKWDEFEKIMLDGAIKRAAKSDLLNDDEVKALTGFKDEIRNPYNHYNIKKITKSVVWGKARLVDTATSRTVLEETGAILVMICLVMPL